MKFRYEIYNIDNNELLWDRANITDTEILYIAQFNLEISILTNLSKGDSLRVSNANNDDYYEFDIVKKCVEFRTSNKETITMILKIWVRDENGLSDLSKIPEWWTSIEG